MKKESARDYDYEFPAELIAQKPASPRDSARLLLHDRKTGKTGFDVFRNLSDHIPKGAVLVLNETKVIPARLTLRKPTGGRVKILFLGHSGSLIRALADRSLKEGDLLIGPGGKKIEVVRRSGSEYVLKPRFPKKEFELLLERHGETPIPPYIKNPGLTSKKLREEYQTVFARKKGSVAAPTAALHFTARMLRELKKNGTEILRLTLHVNLGTFAPLTEENLRTGKLHREQYKISARTAARLNLALVEKRPIIAVGTTVVRALESAGATGRVRAGRGETDLFIRAGHRPKIVRAFITNFHVPRSSLLMLVSAFMPKKKLLRLYHEAIRRKFRLFSFGDAMFVK